MRQIKWPAILLSLIPLILLIFGNTDWIGKEISYDWIPALSIKFHLKVDALSWLFLWLTALIVPISLLLVNEEKPPLFYGLVLLLEALLIGFFTAQDLALFTFFWEAMLLPLFFILLLWGGENRKAAAMKFILYMIGGSLLMIASVLTLYFTTNQSFDLIELKELAENAPMAPLIFCIFMLAFAVKAPLFPFHAWLPDAYYEAFTTGSILLAALLSKAGIYGIIRIGIGLFPTLMQDYSILFLTLAVMGVFYAGLAACRQNDFKKMIAYASLSHINFLLVGLFVWNETAHQGALLQAFNHGITITALFLVSRYLATRLHSTSMDSKSGLATYLPHLTYVTLFFALAAVALPGTNNFVGELMILFGLFNEKPWVAAFLATSIILSVVYIFRWIQKIYFGPSSPFEDSWTDLNLSEFLLTLPLITLILWLGIYPQPLLEQIKNI